MGQITGNDKDFPTIKQVNDAIKNIGSITGNDQDFPTIKQVNDALKNIGDKHFLAVNKISLGDCTSGNTCINLGNCIAGSCAMIDNNNYLYICFMWYGKLTNTGLKKQDAPVVYQLKDSFVYFYGVELNKLTEFDNDIYVFNGPNGYSYIAGYVRKTITNEQRTQILNSTSEKKVFINML